MKLKVKAWFGKEKQMLPVRELYQSDDSGVYAAQVIRKDEEGAEYWYTLAPGRFVLLQFTGLLDKNGKEIYEGDILQVNVDTPIFNSMYQKVLQVIWQDQIAQFVMATPNTLIEGDIPKNCEIIGNIYEKPELLHA